MWTDTFLDNLKLISTERRERGENPQNQPNKTKKLSSHIQFPKGFQKVCYTLHIKSLYYRNYLFLLLALS